MTQVTPAPAIEERPAANWFTPGRSIRVPVGYLVPLMLLLAAMIVGAYATGYQARKSEELRAQSDSAAQEMAALVDPLTVPAATDRAAAKPSPVKPAPKPTATPSTSVNRSVQGPGEGVPGAKGALLSASDKTADQGRGGGVITVKSPADDPRQAGLNYLIAATLPPDEAEKAAAFLVSRGLEIAVVRADNASLRWVVVLQGVAAKDLGGPSAKALEQRLQSLGREYKQVLKGPTVFNDPWWKKHTK